MPCGCGYAQSKEAAEPSADCCGKAGAIFPYCNDVCKKDHHFQMDINLPATVNIKLEVSAPDLEPSALRE